MLLEKEYLSVRHSGTYPKSQHSRGKGSRTMDSRLCLHTGGTDKGNLLVVSRFYGHKHLRQTFKANEGFNGTKGGKDFRG